MATKRISFDLDEPLHRRFKARVAYFNASMTSILNSLINNWVGTWGNYFQPHIVQEGEDLPSIAQRYYNDPERYWTIVYFNDLSDINLLQGQELWIPEPGATPSGLVPGVSIPENVPKIAVSVEIDELLHRRFKARTAFEATAMSAWLYDFVAAWTGKWPTKTASYTVKAGDTLSTIAFRFYNDARKYWVIAYFNGIANPALIHVGQQLIIPEPVTVGLLPAGESPYIFGIHDQGGEHLMAAKSKKGWVLITEEIGRNPYDYSGKDYSALQNAGYGVIVRLNHGYSNPSLSNYPGTIPERDANAQNYREFAVRCGNFVEQSKGCHIWIIGNEMNHPNEWPGGPQGQPITPQRYADCFKCCYEEIHKRPGHKDDQVVIGAVAPWNAETKYPGNERGDWIKYLADILIFVGNKCDGIALHTYTHGPEPTKITSYARMNAPFEDRYFEFRTYRQFMEAIPPSMRHLPVYITETDQNDPWARTNTGWVQAAYAEIDRWNQDLTHQKIRCLLLYRWLAHDQWSFAHIPEILDDFRAAMNNDYRWWR
nr:LysM peptidoglycan-binding domain-containing protein [Chloroflexota bacterium]